MIGEIPKRYLFSKSVYERFVTILYGLNRGKYDAVEVEIAEHDSEDKVLFPQFLVKYFEPFCISKITAINMILRMFVTEVEDGYSEKKKSVLTAINKYPGMSESEKSKLISYILKESV